MIPPLSRTKEGFELQFGVNHVGHFMLTRLLLNKLKDGSPSRIVNVSSLAHKRGRIAFEDLNWEKRSYSSFDAYAQSKLANVLFSRELNERLKGTGVSSYSLHPGVIPTELGRSHWYSELFYKLGKPFFKTIPQGAATTIYVATSPDVATLGGHYFSDCHVLY
eukprot:TRINITY_DN4204_c0_g1_i12.p1 TRINITY_DN4204_c0_g1~~TRINITY_DN4204_c0_g1_i12.p1  ORF type:complete len:163 (-),score=24.40 TRINITY_DN4204_c0_g1_i12:334-822(-)